MWVWVGWTVLVWVAHSRSSSQLLASGVALLFPSCSGDSYVNWKSSDVKLLSSASLSRARAAVDGRLAFGFGFAVGWARERWEEVVVLARALLRRTVLMPPGTKGAFGLVGKMDFKNY